MIIVHFNLKSFKMHVTSASLQHEDGIKGILES